MAPGPHTVRVATKMAPFVGVLLGLTVAVVVGSVARRREGDALGPAASRIEPAETDLRRLREARHAIARVVRRVDKVSGLIAGMTSRADAPAPSRPNAAGSHWMTQQHAPPGFRLP